MAASPLMPDSASPTARPAEAPTAWAAVLGQLSERQARFLRELIPLFLAECPKMLIAIREAVAARDAARLKGAAHTLKGSVGFFAGDAVTEIVERLETMGRQGNLAGAEEACLALEKALDQLLPALAAFANEEAPGRGTGLSTSARSPGP